jgi:hypothetical protein
MAFTIKELETLTGIKPILSVFGNNVKALNLPTFLTNALASQIITKLI